MARYKLILTYDGTRFCGFQKQALQSRAASVQNAIEEALKQLGWVGNSLLSAGRTDSGVHAEGQVVVVDFDWRHSTEQFRSALNAHLSPDLAVLDVAVVDDHFHPRYNAISRRYRYQVFCSEIRRPLLERYNWRVWPKVDTGLMEQACQYLLGQHDFNSFGSPPKKGGSTVRTVFEAGWRPAPEEKQGCFFEILADGYLNRMVRRLVGFQIAIAHNKFQPEAIGMLLEKPLQFPVQTLAPPHGLYLVEVIY